MGISDSTINIDKIEYTLSESSKEKLADCKIGDTVKITCKLSSDGITVEMVKDVQITPSGVTMWGDANCDGDVNITDAAKIMSYVSNSEKYPLKDQELKNSDVNQSGDGINNMDALSIRKKLAQIITELPESFQ